MGDPADADEFEGQQAQQGANRGDDCGARVAGGGDQGRQVEGDQLRDGQQQPGQLRLRPGGQLGEVADLVTGGHLGRWTARSAPTCLLPKGDCCQGNPSAVRGSDH